MAGKSNPKEAKARPIRPGSIADQKARRDRLVTLRFKLLARNPNLQKPDVKKLDPDWLDPGSPLPDMDSEAVTRGGVLRLRDLNRRIALCDAAIRRNAKRSRLRRLSRRRKQGMIKAPTGPEAAAVQSGGNRTETRSKSRSTSPARLNIRTPQKSTRREPHPNPETLLAGKTFVGPRTAMEVLGVGERQVRNLIANGTLEKAGQGHTPRITADSLRRRLGIARNSELTGT